MNVESGTLDRSALEGKVLSELQAIAEAQGISGHQRMRKADLIEAILEQVQGLATVANRNEVQSVMALVARCAVEVGDRLAQLSEELKNSREEMARGSASTSQYTAALVRWTKVSVWMFSILTGGLLIVGIVSLVVRK